MARALAGVFVPSVRVKPGFLRHEGEAESSLRHTMSWLSYGFEFAPQPQNPGVDIDHRHPGLWVLGDRRIACADKVADEHAHQEAVAGTVEIKFFLRVRRLDVGEDSGVAVANGQDIWVIIFGPIFFLVFGRDVHFPGAFWLALDIRMGEGVEECSQSNGPQLVHNQ